MDNNGQFPIEYVPWENYMVFPTDNGDFQQGPAPYYDNPPYQPGSSTQVNAQQLQTAKGKETPVPTPPGPEEGKWGRPLSPNSFAAAVLDTNTTDGTLRYENLLIQYLDKIVTNDGINLNLAPAIKQGLGITTVKQETQMWNRLKWLAHLNYSRDRRNDDALMVAAMPHLDGRRSKNPAYTRVLGFVETYRLTVEKIKRVGYLTKLKRIWDDVVRVEASGTSGVALHAEKRKPKKKKTQDGGSEEKAKVPASKPKSKKRSADDKNNTGGTGAGQGGKAAKKK